MLGSNEYTLVQFREEFPDHEACLGYLWRTRHAAADGEHAECPHCQTVRLFKRYRTAQRRHSWTCTACGRHLQPTAGTIFHKSSTPLDRWFSAIYLITATDGKISAKQLERELGVTYKTAWRMSGLIRGRIAVPVTIPAADPVEHGEEVTPARHRDLEPVAAGTGVLSRRIRRQMARVAHEQRIARHHASDIYSQGIASIRQKNRD
jgi:transposase-like protein